MPVEHCHWHVQTECGNMLSYAQAPEQAVPLTAICSHSRHGSSANMEQLGQFCDTMCSSTAPRFTHEASVALTAGLRLVSGCTEGLHMYKAASRSFGGWNFVLGRAG